VSSPASVWLQGTEARWWTSGVFESNGMRSNFFHLVATITHPGDNQMDKNHGTSLRCVYP